MKLLLVTEKCNVDSSQRDGGARLIETLKNAFGNSLQIMQFGPQADASATWYFKYINDLPNRFERRLANADFIAERVKEVEHLFTHVIFIHVSMQFGLMARPLRKDLTIWTFPMFLTPSYRASGESVPEKYFELEKVTLTHSTHILTPSHFEKKQLIETYQIAEEHIHVIPRGINSDFITPEIKVLKGPPKFCSIGSIKSQKNTLGLIRLFSKIRAKYPQATLRIIGPIQDTNYHAIVCKEIEQLNLCPVIELVGYVSPDQLPKAISGMHVHISTSTCETFGRTIFETLASGLPNIARFTENAAADFLQQMPYIRFVHDDNETLNAIEEFLNNLTEYSSMALEVGILYDDKILSRLLKAKICQNNCLAISDFDGTLFHKDDPKKTQRSIEAFRSYPLRIICTARSVPDIMNELEKNDLKVDWIIGYSGSVVADGKGSALWQVPLEKEHIELLKTIPGAKMITIGDHILQIATSYEQTPKLTGLRTEIYQDIVYITNWNASKLRAINRLLNYINWPGQILAFGDGPYDSEFLTYFDGIRINASTDIKKWKYQ